MRENFDHGVKCTYCGCNYACNCEWPVGNHMCSRCDTEAEEFKFTGGTCRGYGPEILFTPDFTVDKE
jgi:hypothetical protein